jgi:hypothetical protein
MPQSDDAVEAREGYERKTAALIGQRITGVTYWDVYNYSGEPRTWDYGDWHHAVIGVELTTKSGPLSVLWTNTFYPYGVEVFPGPISKHLRPEAEDPQGWPVETHPYWHSRTGCAVQGVATCWEQIEVGPGFRADDGRRVSEPERYSVPIALRLDFQVGPVWMVAVMPSWPDVENVFVPADEIMVVFTSERMHKIGFAETDFLSAGRAL